MSTIRSIHHLACTGGSVISKAIAAQDDVVFLSEIAPAGATQSPRFDPLAPFGQFCSNFPELTRDAEPRLRIVRQQIEEIVEICEQNGKTLVIRDHAHSDFMLDKFDRPLTPELLEQLGETRRAAVTVRYPFASYMSLSENNWLGRVRNYADYCERYLKFLDAYEGAEIVRFEDFGAAPDEAIETLCKALDLGFNPDYQDEMFSQPVTGNSGRESKARLIELPPVRAWSTTLNQELAGCRPHIELCKRLGYPGYFASYVIQVNQQHLMRRPEDEDAAITLDKAMALRNRTVKKTAQAKKEES